MTGTQLYNLLTSILSGEQIDLTYALQLINIARSDFENRRPWSVLKAKDTSLTSLSGQNIAHAYAMPSPATPSASTPYLMSYLLDGALRLVNTTNSNQITTLREIPFENQLDYQGDNAFYVDYANRNFYILGNIPGTYTINQFFIADYGDITSNLTWVGFPDKFVPMLVFQAAARWRMGTDYDDIAAKNGDDNYKTSEAIYKNAVEWDRKLALNASQNRDFSAVAGGAGVGYYPSPDNYGSYGVI